MGGIFDVEGLVFLENPFGFYLASLCERKTKM